MQILYDLQKALQSAEEGNFTNSGIVSVRQQPFTEAVVKMVEDVKTIQVINRADRNTGFDIALPNMPALMEGDRITLTGRVADDAPPGRRWSMVLRAKGKSLVQHVSPRPVFSLSHILSKEDLAQAVSLHTIYWDGQDPIMYFNLDSIIITRRTNSDNSNVDTRTTIYSLANDTNVTATSKSSSTALDSTIYLTRSGSPLFDVQKNGAETIIHVGTRVNSWDGVDINFSRMGLRTGNKYKIIVSGRMGSDVPPKSKIMFQGVPTYTWQSDIDIASNQPFTISHTLSPSEMEQWSAIRVTCDPTGATASFSVNSIEITRVN